MDNENPMASDVMQAIREFLDEMNKLAELDRKVEREREQEGEA